VNFEWDPLKDRENQQKHGVSFAEAARAWLDPRRITRAIASTAAARSNDASYSVRSPVPC
jgi:uncharacterized DUF497 family protein